MKLHEYQGKELVRRFGVAVPKGFVVFSVAEARKAVEQLSLPIVVKAQIQAGGRGKGGGVKVAKSVAEAEAHAQAILGMTLVTHQTGPEGKKVNRLLIEEGCAIVRELYLGMTLDRTTSLVTLIASTEGGIDIEEVAARSSEKILKLPVDPVAGIDAGALEGLAKSLQLTGSLVADFIRLAVALERAYHESDASLLEINPLVVTADERLIALDAKIVIDDNALFRHPEFEAWRDESEEEPAELEARKFGLSYIKLDGNIGCMVNGAGLAMATMDLIQLAGGVPANFLDVGGSATKENVAEAFKIILRDSKVKAILVNIFGGIMKCDIIAAGIIAATKELHVTVPIVVRLQGTNVERGRELLRSSGLNITPADGLAEAAKRIVEIL